MIVGMVSNEMPGLPITAEPFQILTGTISWSCIEDNGRSTLYFQRLD